MKTIQDKKIINRILNKAVEEVIPSKELLKKALLSGEKLRIYQGFDPTGPTLHIGHTVGMRKLEDFRKLGHHVIFLIGDFTGRIGDPSDKMASRQQLTQKEVEENLKLYKEQASRIIDINNKDNPVEVLFNSEWLSKLNFEDVLNLASKFTVQQMLKRDMFKKRLEENKPIHIHEFMYPLMQAKDALEMEVDIEVGGNDQLFNMLAGRSLIKNVQNKEKIVIAGKLLTTGDGAKMGKSEGNMIKLSDSSNDIYGKVMAFPDEHIIPGFELLTNMELTEVEKIEKRLEDSNPMDLKKELAFELTKDLRGEKEAKKAQEYFESVFQHVNKKVKIPTITISDDKKNILELLVDLKITSSKSQARRLVEQGAVNINDKKITDFQDEIKIENDIIVKVGKKIVKIKRK